MEELLASIRKAMDDDPHSKGDGSREPGAFMRGALREMRVAFDRTESAAPSADVGDLRQRVSRNNAEAGFSAPPLPPITGTPQDNNAPRSGFAKILAGLKTPPGAVSQSPVREEAPPPFLRRTIVQDEGDEVFDPPSAPPPQDYMPYEDEPAQESSHHEPPPYPTTAYAPPPVQRQPAPPRQPPRSRPAPPEPPPQRALVSESVARSSRRSFEDLAEALLARAPGERDLEDMTREMLRGMLRQWLDDNLPSIVEQLVREEIERVARRGH